MSGCEGCFISARGQQENYTTVKKAAIEYAKTNQVDVAIYKEGFETFYCEYSVAIQQRYFVVETLYHTSPTS